MAKVSVDPRYWVEGVRRDYSDWVAAWPREAGQNSLDAGATLIDIQLSSIGFDRCRVVWSDNGHGMSRRIMIDKLMRLGGTEKADGAVGGYGVAAALLLYTQKNYRVSSTGGTLVGQLDDYDWDETADKVSGTVLEVTVDCGADALGLAIRKWARWTTTQCVIKLDGEKLECLVDTGPERACVGSWAVVKVPGDDYADYGGLKIRINGQYMHNVSCSVGKPLVVDIVGSSLDYFTSNRDSLKYKYKTELSAFVEKLFRDPTMVIELEEGVATRYEGTEGLLVVGVRTNRKVAEVTRDRAAIAAASRLVEVADATAKLSLTVRSASDEVTSTLMHRGHTLIVDNKLEGRVIAPEWIPGSMSKHAKTLMKRWIGLISVCSDIIGYGDSIAPGWVFSSVAAAMYQWQRDGVRILVNPCTVDEMGNMKKRFDLRSRAQFYELVEDCVHELTHGQGYSWHDEKFAVALGVNMRKVMVSISRVEAVFNGKA